MNMTNQQVADEIGMSRVTYESKKKSGSFTVSECVKLSGVSSRRFSDIFKASFNMTPNRYIVHRKVEYARELLRSGSLSVSEVAEICGFCDVYYFSRVFKAETGVPPKEWR